MSQIDQLKQQFKQIGQTPFGCKYVLREESKTNWDFCKSIDWRPGEVKEWGSQSWLCDCKWQNA